MFLSDNAQHHPLKFTGNGSEYFKIWIVNLCLSILTLGIYSAWAKVRTKRYFYGNTQLAGSAFEYLARPGAILKGRIVALVAFSFYVLASEFNPIAGGFLWLASMFAFPWVLVRALMFRAHSTGFRSLCFRFDRVYTKAFKLYLLLPFVAALSLGLFMAFLGPVLGPERLGLVLVPLMILAYAAFHQMATQFIVNHSGYGNMGFRFSARANDFLVLYFKTLAVFVAMALAFGAMVGLSLAAAGFDLSQVLIPGADNGFLSPIALLVPFIYGFAFAFWKAQFANLVFNHTYLLGESSDIKLQSTQTARGLFRIYVGNVLGIVCTLGLYTPWAKVRLAQYRAENLSLLAEGSLEDVSAGQIHEVSAVGEEIGEMFDLAVGF